MDRHCARVHQDNVGRRQWSSLEVQVAMALTSQRRVQGGGGGLGEHRRSQRCVRALLFSSDYTKVTCTSTDDDVGLTLFSYTEALSSAVVRCCRICGCARLWAVLGAAQRGGSAAAPVMWVVGSRLGQPLRLQFEPRTHSAHFAHWTCPRVALALHRASQ